MRLPWVSRELYDLALKQIEDLKAANASLLTLALTKETAPVKSDKEEEEESAPTKPQRRLVKQIREEAEQTLRLKAAASRKK